jgi:hypothetical protein
MTKNLILTVFLFSMLTNLSLLAQNKMQTMPIAQNNVLPYRIAGQLFYPASQTAFCFEGINTAFEALFPEKRIAKMSFSGTISKEEMEIAYAANDVTYKNIYENIDLQVLGNAENMTFRLAVHPYGKTTDIAFKVENGKDWISSSPMIWQEIEGKKRILKADFDVNEQQVTLKIANYDAFETLYISFPAKPLLADALSRK